MPQSENGASRAQVTPETLGRELKDALPIKRIQSLSIHDRDGDAVWLSEDQLGPDEHNVVLEAITVFEVEGNRAYVSEDLGDGRSAAFFASSSPHGELVGVAMVIADKRSIDTLGAGKLVTPKVRSLMQRLAIVMKPGSVIPGRKNSKPVASSSFGKNPFAIAEADDHDDIEDFGSASDIFSPPELPVDPAVLARQPRRNAPANGTAAPKIPEARPGERVAARATIRSDAPSVLRQSDPAAQIAGLELATPARPANKPTPAPSIRVTLGDTGRIPAPQFSTPPLSAPPAATPAESLPREASASPTAPAAPAAPAATATAAAAMPRSPVPPRYTVPPRAATTSDPAAIRQAPSAAINQPDRPPAPARGGSRSAPTAPRRRGARRDHQQRIDR